MLHCLLSLQALLYEPKPSPRVMLTWFPALDSQAVTPIFPPSSIAGLKMATPSFVTAAPVTLHPEMHCCSLHDMGRAMCSTWTCPSWGPWEWDGAKLYPTGPHLTQRLGGDGRKFADCYSEGKSTSRATKLCFQLIYVGIKGHFLVRSAVRICKWKERLETYLHFYEGMYQCLALLQSHIKLSLSNSSLMHHSQQWF